MGAYRFWGIQEIVEGKAKPVKKVKITDGKV